MRDNGTFHHRRSIRLKGWDYAAPGAYSFDIVTQDRVCLFGRVADDKVILSRYGAIVQEVWEALPSHFGNVALDAFVVMPDHVHGVVLITGPSRGSEIAPGDGHPADVDGPIGPRGTAPGSLAAIVQSFKSVSTRKINQLRGTPGARVWQRNYYERIVRDDRALAARRRYVANNPKRWGHR